MLKRWLCGAVIARHQSNAAALDVGCAAVMGQLLVVKTTLPIAKVPGDALGVAVDISLCGGKNSIVIVSAAHGVRLGTSVVDHGGELATSRVDEPVGNLV